MSSATKSDLARLRAILDAYLEAKGKIDGNLERLARGYGLCASQALVLLDALAHPGTGLTELCGRTGLKKSAASKQVESLVGMGLLARAEAEGDRRALALEAGGSLGGKGFCSNASMKAIFPGWKGRAGGSSGLDSIHAALRLLSELAGSPD